MAPIVRGLLESLPRSVQVRPVCVDLLLGRMEQSRAIPVCTVSDEFDIDAVGMCRECADVGLVSGENGPTFFGESDNESVDDRPFSCVTSKLSGAARRRLGKRVLNEARLEESIDVLVSTRAALDGLDEHDGWNDRWPHPIAAESFDERERFRCSFSESTHAAAIEDKHASACFVAGTVPDSAHDCVGPCTVTVCWLSDLAGEFRQIALGGIESVSTFKLGSDGDLEEFGRG